jgi:hypothetical protein
MSTRQDAIALDYLLFSPTIGAAITAGIASGSLSFCKDAAEVLLRFAVTVPDRRAEIVHAGADPGQWFAPVRADRRAPSVHQQHRSRNHALSAPFRFGRKPAFP